MRLAVALALALLASAPAARAPSCVGVPAAEACATVGGVPSASASVDMGAGADASAFVESGAVIVPIVATFYGPTQALAYKHFLVPTVIGEIAFYEFGIVGTWGGVCMWAGDRAACVPFLV